jgi:hypothetical protein
VLRSLLLFGALAVACEGSIARPAPAAVDAPIHRPPPAPRVSTPTSPPASELSRSPGEARRPLTWPSPAPSAQPAAAPVIEPGRADLDPQNDAVVAPPEAIADCDARLTAAGVRHRPATLPLRQPRRGTYTCGAPQAVVYERGPTELRFNAPPIVTCGMALALARFEQLLQSDAERMLGSRVTRVKQGGTYSCRKMARFREMVSEHSYGNAIDIYSLTLTDGRVISVKGDFGRLDREPVRGESTFLRELAHHAFDQGVFSVVLTPFWDRLHHDHLHLDLARYRVDGSRP